MTGDTRTPYTPSLDEARRKYATGATWLHQRYAPAADEFDRMIALVKAEALASVITPEAREHWAWTQGRRARFGDTDCVCPLCGVMKLIEKGAE